MISKNKAIRIPHGSPRYKRLQAEVLERDGNICLISGEWTDAPPHHVEYLSNGGGDTLENMATISNEWHDPVHHGNLYKVIERIVLTYGPKKVLKCFLLGLNAEKTCNR